MSTIDKYLEDNRKAMKEIYGYDTQSNIIQETNIYADRRSNLYIGVFVDEGRKLYLDPYFKVSWKPINYTNTDIARISMSTGDYIIHYNSTVVLNRNIQKQINEIFDKVLINGNNIWTLILSEIAKIYSHETNLKELIKKYPQIPINAHTIPKGTKTVRWKG